MTANAADTRPDTPEVHGRVNGVHPTVAALTAPLIAAPDHPHLSIRVQPIDTPTPVAPHAAGPTPRRTDTPTPDSGDGTGRRTQSAAEKRVLVGVSIALGAVILAPLTLSAQDLYHWAKALSGLYLSMPWPLLVPVALDLAAAACIGMTVVAAWRRDKPGVFGLLVWVFATVSAVAQYKHGDAERHAGRAQDAYWAMPAFALLGPLLLELTLHRIRRWARKDVGEQHSGAAGFGSRWLPGVAFRETFDAWRTSRREGIDRAADAVSFVRDRKAVRGMTPVEAVRYAFDAIDSTNSRQARVWLSARGVQVTQADIDRAVAPDPAPVVPTPSTPGQARADTPTGRKPATRQRRPRKVATPRQVAPAATPVAPAPTAAVDTFSSAAVANAAELRQRYGDTLPTADNPIRQATGWSLGRVQKAREAHAAGADQKTSTGDQT